MKTPTPNNQDRLLSDEELRKTTLAMFTTDDPRRMTTITDELVLDNLMSLINTQKRLYAESVIGQDQADQVIDDTLQSVDIPEAIIRNELRAEQRKRIDGEDSL